MKFIEKKEKYAIVRLEDNDVENVHKMNGEAFMTGDADFVDEKQNKIHHIRCLVLSSYGFNIEEDYVVIFNEELANKINDEINAKIKAIFAENTIQVTSENDYGYDFLLGVDYIDNAEYLIEKLQENGVPFCAICKEIYLLNTTEEEARETLLKVDRKAWEEDTKDEDINYEFSII